MPDIVGTQPVEAVEMRVAPIGQQQVREATDTLQRYKRGKSNLDDRVIDEEQWYKLRHWEAMRRKRGGGEPEPASAWLFNVLSGKHADAMDNYPSPNVFSREASDEEDARMLQAVIPVVLERADFEGTYSLAWWDKLKHGFSVYSPVWDAGADGGLGEVAIREVDPLNLYWEPGVEDIQESPNVFVLSLVDKRALVSQYPGELTGRTLGQTVTPAQYIHDDDIDTTGKALVIDWYYKLRDQSGRTVLHYCKYVDDIVLYSSQNEGRPWYDHGQYPFVFDVLFPDKGTPAGFGYVAVCRDPQMYIDALSGNILENTALATKPRYFVRDNSAIKTEDLLDTRKKVVPVEGSLDDLNLRKIDIDPVDGNSISVMQLKIDEMKETSGSRDVSNGSASGGVTAASAIAALQEAGNKTSRDMINQSYRAYRQVIYMVLELMRQFYTETRYFRITAPNGQAEYVAFNAQRIRQQQTGVDISGQPTYRRPIFDIKITAQKRSAISREVENQRAQELYAAGFFNPERAQEALIALDMMDFEGIDKVREKVQQGQTLLNVVRQLMVQMDQMAAIIQGATGYQPAEETGQTGQQAQRGQASSGGQNLGARQQQAMTANATPQAVQIARQTGR